MLRQRAVVEVGDHHPVVGLQEHQIGEELLGRIRIEQKSRRIEPDRFVDGHHLQHVALAERRDRSRDEVVVE